jgi:hypothetical protein
MRGAVWATAIVLLGAPALAAEDGCEEDVDASGRLVECPCCRPCGDGSLIWSENCPEEFEYELDPLEEPAAVAEPTTSDRRLAFAAFIAVGYFLPYGVARLRGHSRSRAIFRLNLLLGWTGLGWIAALIWAHITIRDLESW